MPEQDRNCDSSKIGLLTCMNLVFKSTLNVRNEYFIIKVLVLVSTITVILSLTYNTHEGRAITSTNNSSLTEVVQVGAPFYIQH